MTENSVTLQQVVTAAYNIFLSSYHKHNCIVGFQNSKWTNFCQSLKML